MSRAPDHQQHNFLKFASVVITVVGQLFFVSNNTLAQGLVVEDDADPHLLQMGAMRRSDFNRYHSGQIAEATVNLELARLNKSNEPAVFINRLLELASAFRFADQRSKSDTLCNEALTLFVTETPVKGTSRVRLRYLWNFVLWLPEREAETKAASLYKAAELYAPAVSDTLFLDALRDRRIFGSAAERAAYQMKLIQMALVIKTIVRGAKDPSLARLKSVLAQVRAHGAMH